MIFVDTGPWFAAGSERDERHGLTIDWFERNREQLVTTDFVIDETLTLLRKRGEPHRALEMGELLFSRDLARIHHVAPAEVQEAWTVFQKFSDKEWSFTDCTSFVVMRRLGVVRALAFDRHFHQFGGITVLP